MPTCREVMHATSTSLYMDDPLETALDFIMQRHMTAVPVVDRQQRFVGLLAGERLMRALLPKHLTMIRGLDRMGYLRESKEELRERLDELARRPISEVMQSRVEVVYPDTPLIEAHSILAAAQSVVPVVERDTGRLLGAISFFTLLALLRDEPSGSDRLLNAETTAKDL